MKILIDIDIEVIEGQIRLTKTFLDLTTMSKLTEVKWVDLNE